LIGRVALESNPCWGDPARDPSETKDRNRTGNGDGPETGSRPDELRSRDPAEARAKLRGIVELAVARLEARREVHEPLAEVAAANQVARLSLDASLERERLRRSQFAANRSLLRTLETLRKFRRDGGGPQPDPAETDGSNSPAGSEHLGEPSRPAQADD
jgi:hypothetical protein